MLVRGGQGAARWTHALMERLFDRVSFHAHLSFDERWRYQEANRLAKRFCERLLPHVKAGRLDRLLDKLRHAYRLGAEAKLQHLAAR